MQAASAQPGFVDDTLRLVISGIELIGVAVIVVAAIVATSCTSGTVCGNGAWGPTSSRFGPPSAAASCSASSS